MGLFRNGNSNGREKVFTCNVCNRSFGYKHVLQNHERTHTGEKPFECKECHKRFTRDHHLKTHMRLHTGEREGEREGLFLITDISQGRNRTVVPTATVSLSRWRTSGATSGSTPESGPTSASFAPATSQTPTS